MKVGLLYSAIMTCLVWAGTPACSIAACTEGEGNGSQRPCSSLRRVRGKGVFLSLENFY